MAMVDGLTVEVSDLAGDRGRRSLVLLLEGLGSVVLWRGFPQALHEATGRRVPAFSRFGHGSSDPPRSPRTPAFFHEEALDVLPALLEQLDAPEPLLVGHSDGGSIALIHAGRHPVSGLALLAPHVVVEDVTIEAIRVTRREFEEGELRARMARHHADPDAAFRGWCDVWLDPAFRAWNLGPTPRRSRRRRCSSRAPTTPTVGAHEGVGSIDQDYPGQWSPPSLSARGRRCETRANCTGTPRPEPPTRAERQAHEPPVAPFPR